MINLLVVIIGVSFLVISAVFAVVTAKNTRNHYYNDFVKRKSEREKLRVSR